VGDSHQRGTSAYSLQIDPVHDTGILVGKDSAEHPVAIDNRLGVVEAAVPVHVV
jgi:hypothetical protein